MWTQKLTWAPPLYRGRRSGKRAESNPWFPMLFSKAPIWPFINTHVTNRRARGSDMSGAFIAWRRHLPSMTLYNYPPFISDHDLHLSINDIKIMGGYCRGDEQNSGLRPKGLERSHLKGWLCPSLWVIKGNISKRSPQSSRYATNIETLVWGHKHGWPYSRQRKVLGELIPLFAEVPLSPGIHRETPWRDKDHRDYHLRINERFST